MDTSTDSRDKSAANTWRSIAEWPFTTVVLGFVCLLPIYLLLIPWHYYTDNWATNARALGVAFLCGALVGLTEIASRYRDEQVKAISSPDGLVYILFNGAISTFALMFVWYFHDNPAFAMITKSPLGGAIAAGFGATAIMRTRLAVIKGSDNKDVSIGPDIVLSLLLTMIDRRIDRWRSLRRQRLIAQRFEDLKALGSIDDASEYLLGSLISFQNISETDKKEVNAQVQQNKAAKVRDPYIQLTTLGYIFLTVIGEENFDQALTEAKNLQNRKALAGDTRTDSPATLTTTPPSVPPPAVPAPPSTPLVGTPPPPVPPTPPPTPPNP
ncbi:MAG TPA: hypothetical protein VJU77_04600 [Chthoniobacterales bacterium]|nr:hypothetical protein [Chthoniobacterales bacterium]